MKNKGLGGVLGFYHLFGTETYVPESSESEICLLKVWHGAQPGQEGMASEAYVLTQPIRCSVNCFGYFPKKSKICVKVLNLMRWLFSWKRLSRC